MFINYLFAIKDGYCSKQEKTEMDKNMKKKKKTKEKDQQLLSSKYTHWSDKKNVEGYDKMIDCLTINWLEAWNILFLPFSSLIEMLNPFQWWENNLFVD